MIEIVEPGTFKIVKKSSIVLKTGSLGAGIAIGILDKKNKVIGLLSYLFPYKEFDLEIDGKLFLSGESVLPLFFQELEKNKIDFNSTKIVVAGANCYRGFPPELDLAERNKKVAHYFLKNSGILEENILYKTQMSFPSILEVNLEKEEIAIEYLGMRVVLW